MGGRVGVWLTCLVGLALAACGGGPRQAVPERSESPSAQLAPPSALHGASYTQQGLFRWGRGYGDALPHDNVSRVGMESAFSPSWAGPGDQVGGLAYATFQFHLTGSGLDPSVRFTWTQTGVFSNGWVALADFPRNCWSWHSLPAGGVLAFDPAEHVSDLGILYVVVMVTGTAPWQLQELWVGVDGARGNWWMFGRDPQHTRRSPIVGAQTATVKWTHATGDYVCSSPAIGADGTVYVGGDDHYLYAINPNGTLKWSYPTGNYVLSSPAIGTDGTVYIGSSDHDLYAVNPDGSLKWVYSTGSYIYSSSPAVAADGTVYVGSYDDKLYAINSDGSLRWSFPTRAPVFSSPAIGADGTVYVGSCDCSLYAIEPDGTLKWECPTGGWVKSGPAIGADGTIYVGNCDFNLYAIKPDGTLKWKYPTGGWVESSPAIGADGTVYMGSEDNNIYAIRPDGTLNWSYPTGDSVWSSPAIAEDGTVYVGSDDGNLYAFADP